MTVPQTATAMVTGSPRKNHALPAAKTALSGLPAAARLHCRESQEEVRNEDRGERRDTWRRLAVFTRECDGIRSSASFTLCVPPENADDCFPDSSQGRGITRSCPNRRHQRGLGYFRVVLGLGAREGRLADGERARGFALECVHRRSWTGHAGALLSLR